MHEQITKIKESKKVLILPMMMLELLLGLPTITNNILKSPFIPNWKLIKK